MFDAEDAPRAGCVEPPSRISARTSSAGPFSSVSRNASEVCGALEVGDARRESDCWRAFFHAATVPSPASRVVTRPASASRAPPQSIAMRRTATSKRKSTAARIAMRSHMRRALSGIGKPSRKNASTATGFPIERTRPPVRSAICSSSARLSRTVRNSFGYGTLTEACTLARRPSSDFPSPKLTRYEPASVTGNSARQRPGPICTAVNSRVSPVGVTIIAVGSRLVANPPLGSVASKSTIAVSPSTRDRTCALVGTAGRSSQRIDCSQNARYSPHVVHDFVQRVPASDVNAIERPSP